jgi:hypothetical protein
VAISFIKQQTMRKEERLKKYRTQGGVFRNKLKKYKILDIISGWINYNIINQLQ